METFQLKKPFGVHLLAVLFLLAPIGNILINFKDFAPDYPNASFWDFLGAIAILDWSVLALTFVTGILLFRPHKTSWSLAIVTLIAVFSLNIYRWKIQSGLPLSIDQTQLILSCSTTLAILVLVFYFRFPYLDRRDQWFFPTARRFTVALPVTLLGSTQFEGTTEAISTTGARITLIDAPAKTLQSDTVEVILPTIGGLKIEAEVISSDNKMVIVKFKKLSTAVRKSLLEALKTS